MARIAVLDALFNWPPDGGARTDLKEITSRLAKDHDVRMFVPDFTWKFPRGVIRTDLPFEVTKIPFNRLSFNWYTVCRRMRRHLQAFSPDYAFIADAWYMKPHMLEAAREFPTIVRFYAYESTCIRSHGTLFADDKICAEVYPQRNWYGRMKCVACSLRWLAGTKNRLFSHEFLTSLAFTGFYTRRLTARLRDAKRIIVYNEIARKRLMPFSDRISVVTGGIDHDRFTPMPPDPTRTQPVILMVGRAMDHTKGFHVLYEACKRLWRHGKKFSLQCTAAGDICLEGVENLGWRTQEELPHLYANCDICVVPSIWQEPFGIVALEAMACAKPVIVSAVGGLQEIITDGSEGYIVAPGSVDAIQEKLAILLSDAARRRRMGEAGRRKAVADFGWDTIYARDYAPLFS